MCLDTFGQECGKVMGVFVEREDEGERVGVSVLGDTCSEFILSVCSLLLCISGRELGCSTKSQEGLLDTRVINFFRVPVASV